MSNKSVPSPKRSMLSEITSWFCKPVDNSFALKKYINGDLIMVGDKVSVSRWLRKNASGEVIKLHKHRYVDNFELYFVSVNILGKVYQICPSKIKLINRRELYQDHWKNIYSSDVAFYEEILNRDLYEDLQEVFFSTFSFVCDDFDWGLSLIKTGKNIDLSRKLFERMILRADYVINNNLIERSTKFDFGNLYVDILCCKAYASAILGNSLDKSLLFEAAKRTVDISNEIDPYYWTADCQDRYLSAVRMAMIGDHFDFARDLLKSKRSFKKHDIQLKLLKKIARKSVKPETDSELKEMCLQYLDFLRRPHCSDCCLFGDTLPELEWGILIEKIFNKNKQEVDWGSVIKYVYR